MGNDAARTDRHGSPPIHHRPHQVGGTLHQVRIAHPLSRIPEIAAAFPPIEGGESGGDNYTVNARWVPGRGYRLSGGASYLQVIDVGNWDAAHMTNAPGQSGDPRSPFYGNLLQGWADEAHFPLLWTESAIERNTVQRIRLRPPSASCRRSTTSG